MRQHTLRSILRILLGMMGACGVLHAGMKYRLVDIGTMPGYEKSRAIAINDSGWVLFMCWNGPSPTLREYFFYKDGVIESVDGIPSDGFPMRMNNERRIVGARGNINVSDMRPFVWSNGSFQELPNLGCNFGYAYAINNSGTIAGQSCWRQDQFISANLAVTWNNSGGVTGFSSLTVLCETGPRLWPDVAFDVSENGTVGGAANMWCDPNAKRYLIPFLWKNGSLTRLEIPSGTEGDCAVLGVNSRNEAVGYALGHPSGIRSVLWRNGVIHDLGFNSGLPSRINDQGVILGSNFVWIGDVRHEINSLIQNAGGIQVSPLRDLNQRGEIVGSGLSGIHERAVLLQPKPLHIYHPTRNLLLHPGQRDTIRWHSALERDHLIHIEYSLDDGNSWTMIQRGYPADSNRYIWKVPDSILTKQARIQVRSAQELGIGDTSDVFKIKGHILTRDSSGQYEPFRFGGDRWRFGNVSSNMWPRTWWSQFNYDGTDPFTGGQYGSSIPRRLPFSLADSSDFPDWPLFVNAFGVDHCYWSTFLGIYRPSALLKWNALKRQWGGSCSGFAVSSLLAFADSGGLRGRFPAVPFFADLFSVQLDTAVRKVINELWLHWFGHQHRAYFSTQWGKTPTETIHDLKNILNQDNPDPGYLYLANNGPGGGAHAVTPYRVWHDTVNTAAYWIYVYDNSYHNNASARIRVDTSANGGRGFWTYLLWSTWGGDRWLFVSDPVSSYIFPPILPLSVEGPRVAVTNRLEVFPTLEADILIRNPLGQFIGYADSIVLDGIPGAVPFIPATGSNTPPYSYYLHAGDYSMVLDNFTTTRAELSVFTDNLIFAYTREDAISTQTDRFHYDGSLAFGNPDPEQKVVTLSSVIIEDTTAEKAYALLGCTMSQRDSLHLSMRNHDELQIVNWGTSKTYGLSIESATRTSNPRFYNPSLSIGANSTHWIDPDWTDLQRPIPIYIDLGNDGTIDDTIFVNNTVNVDQEGSLFFPKEFNLGQNYPNPFNQSTRIRYALPHEAHVKLTIYNVLGREVVTLVDERQTAGHHAVAWDGRNSLGASLGSGVYFYRLEAQTSSGRYISTKKMLMMK